jgi:hypothetical protein
VSDSDSAVSSIGRNLRRGTPLGGIALVVALVVILVWLAFLIWLVVDIGTSELTWSRLLIVLGSVESVAFAAVGALFGTSVQRQQVEDFRHRAGVAETHAEANQAAALNGHKLAAAVKATQRTEADGTIAHDPVLEMANALFPD